MQQISPIKERILQYIDYMNVSKYKFYKDSGITRGVLDKESGISEENISKFIAYAPDINLQWLLTGTGSMSKTKSEEKTNKENVSKNVSVNVSNPNVKEKWSNKDLPFVRETKSEYGIPLIPISAMAGFGTGTVQVMDYDTSKYVVPEFSELHVDFMIRIKGSSMQPKYNSGDLIACKKLFISDLFFQWNKVYVLDTEQGALVKRVKQGTKDEHIKLISDNTSYDPFELHLSKIYAIALVVGVIRLE